MKKRIYFLDNVKAILIVLVVLGHCLETVQFQGKTQLYHIIYTFHMPAFVFVSGICFKKATGNKLLKNFVYPYLVFQTIYLAFNGALYGKPVELQYTTPVWALWYLLAMCIWHVFTNAVEITRKNAAFLLLGSLFVSLLAGAEASVGYYFALSRAIVFYPFFLAGACIKTLCFDQFEAFVTNPPKAAWLACLLAGALYIAALIVKAQQLQSRWFYGSMPYKSWHEAIIRAAILTGAALLACLVFFATPKGNLPFLTKMGQNTMPIYLLHGMVIKYLAHKGFFAMLPMPAIAVAVFAVLLVIVLALPPVTFVLKPLCQWPFARKWGKPIPAPAAAQLQTSEQEPATVG